jgi:D-alanyl-D-alanine carboxypeptidase
VCGALICSRRNGHWLADLGSDPPVKLYGCLALATLLLTATAAEAKPPAYILIDADQGTVLADHDADVLMYPASLSKLMTAYVTFSALKAGAIKMTSPVVESQNAQDQPPSKMGFDVGTVMNVDNALKMLLVKSANDIAVAISEAVGGKEPQFVATMNQSAQALGMVSTHYDNPHGLPDPGQVTTARDTALLARALWTTFPEYRSYLGIPAIKAGKEILTSENQLLERYRGTNGMKTGFTCSAGYNLIASATRNGQTLIAVVLGEDSWNDVAEHAASLLNAGFNPPSNDSSIHPELAAFESTPSSGAAVDMTDYGICQPKAKDQQVAEQGSQSAPSSLEPRFVLMNPVVVTTGGADRPGKPAPTVAAIAGKTTTAAAVPAPKGPAVPLPRLRPTATAPSGT